MNNVNQVHVWFKTKKNPQTPGDLALANFLWKIPKLNPFKRKGKRNEMPVSYISTGIENIIVLSETLALVQMR